MFDKRRRLMAEWAKFCASPAAKYPTDEAIAEVTDQIDRALFLTYREDMDAESRCSACFLERAAKPCIAPKRKQSSRTENVP